SWAWPKPTQAHLPVLIGAGGGPKTFAWIARHADGWITTPIEADIADKIARLREAWDAEGRDGQPEVVALMVTKPDPEMLAAYDAAGVTECLWSFPDKPADEA